MSHKPLPPKVVTGVTILLSGLLAFHVIYDALSKSYSDPALSLALLGAVCAALGFRGAL